MPSAPCQPRRTWPVTAGVVLLGWLLIAWTLFGAVITTAPFFGEVPSRDDHVDAGLGTLAAVAPAAVLLLLGLRWGARWGLLLLAGPGLLLVPLGLDWLGRPGDPQEPGHDRPVALADLGGELARTNWVHAAGLLLLLGV